MINIVKGSTIYKNFLSAELNPLLRTTTAVLNKFDEPTYLSFKIRFDTNDLNYNMATATANYDWMPHPLLETKAADGYREREKYSSITYLQDSNEFTRAALLTEFQEKLNAIQDNYQWYFQSITGVDQLFNIKPQRGYRVPEDYRLTVKCMEGLDLRMSYLLALYRRIAWDDEYQRWILPDMMRYFRLRIYVTEFRSFHVPFNQNYQTLLQDTGNGNPSQENPLTSQSQVTSQDLVGNNGNSREYMALQLIDYFMPTYVIDCEQCEFDIESDPYTYLTDLNVTTATEATTEFKIKVGKARILQYFPQFKHPFLDDYALNKLGGRRLDFETATYVTESGGNANQGHIEARILDTGAIPEPHISGMPFRQNANTDITGQTGKAVQATWTDNAVKFGTAFVKNTVKEVVDKAKITPIPGLGVSFSQASTVLESKDIFSVFGLVRQALRNVSEGELAPSARLSGEIAVDQAFRDMLNSISKSTATDIPTQKLAQAANIILNDQGVWQALKDYSLATDLVTKNEQNISNTIKSPTAQSSTIATDTRNDNSWATSAQNSLGAQKGLIYEGLPSSQATVKNSI